MALILHRQARLALACTFALGACRTPEASDTKQENDDRHTPVNLALVDISEKIDAWMNLQIIEARIKVNPLNAPWTSQRKEALVEEVARRTITARPGTGIGVHWQGISLEVSALSEFEAHLIDILAPDRHEIAFTTFKDSRYGDNTISLTHALVIAHTTQMAADHSISPSVRLGSTIIGLDKFGHFAEQGFWYYQAMREGLVESAEERYQFGQFMEGDPKFDMTAKSKFHDIYKRFCKICVIFGGYGYFGTTSTGVCSFADMKANDAGYQFYTDLYAHPQTYRFQILDFNVHEWNEETTKSWFIPGLKVRPDPAPGA